MKRLLIFSLSLVALCSCKQEHDWFKKEYAPEELPSLAQSLSNGVAYHYQGSVPEQFHIKEALKLDSSNGDFWREMGTARVKRGIADEMYYYYDKAATLKPDPWMGFRGYLYLYFYRDYPRAIADFNTMDSLIGTVGNSQAQDHDYMRGIAYYGLKDYTNAIAYLEKYMKRIESEVGKEWIDVNAYLYLALSKDAMHADQQAEEIIEILRKGLELYPNYADLHYHLAWQYYQQSEWKLAKEHQGLAARYFEEGFYHHRPYVEVLNQIYVQDLQELAKLLTIKSS